jgi:hypothetical protein
MYAIIDEQIRQREHSHAAGEARKNGLLDVMLDKEGEVGEESTEDKQSHNTIRGLFTVSILLKDSYNILRKNGR